jgi:hypothetical protein
MAIRNGQEKINPESDRGAERKRPSLARSQRTASRCNLRIAEEKGLLRGGRTLMVRGRIPVALVARKAKDKHFLRFKIAGSRARQHCRAD